MKSNSFLFFLICLLGYQSAFPRSIEPNKPKIDTIVTVIDTIPAMDSFQIIKPLILQEIEDLRDKRKILQAMLQSRQKKAKTKKEKDIIIDAFNYIFNKGGFYSEYEFFDPSGVLPSKLTQDYNNVQKGKITERIRSQLSLYDKNYLADEIIYKTNSLKNNWTSFIKNPPTKQMTIQVDNPDYRGYHYNNYRELNRIERDSMVGEYNFILSEKGVPKKETYPFEVSYLQFKELPNYKVLNNHRKEVYDNKGELVYVPYLERQSDTDLFPSYISKEIRRLVYLNDYQNNKYNIRSAPLKTQNYILLWIGRKHGLSETAIELSGLELSELGGILGFNDNLEETLVQKKRYKDDEGERFLQQLELDHEDDFGYIYVIERLSDKQFHITYLNKTTLEPSVSAFVMFSTGKEPYTSTATVQLTQFSIYPPIILQ
ncbi:MAG: hypothetical protein K2M79_03710 [Muribaculaceae bacterium]|nr:hypothetical protein [Muribaculaceae bacterium]